MNTVNLRMLLAILTMTALLAGGCGKPQPSTWPGIRNMRRDRDAASAKQKPAPRTNTAARKSPWWKPWSRNKQAAPVARKKPVTVNRKPDNDFDRAVLLVKEYKFAKAKGLLKKVIDRDPGYSEAWRWLGDCQYNLLELDDAISSYTRARDIDPNNYLALRGKGFAHLHKGRKQYQDYKRAAKEGDNAKAAEILTMAHENFKLSLELLRECLRLVPADNEAMYGRAMAAECASRKLYSNAVVMLKNGDSTKANAWAERCLGIIDEGIEAAKHRINEYTGDANPRTLVANLFYRRAVLLKNFNQTENAIIAIRKAIVTQQSILDDIDPGNRRASLSLQAYTGEMQKWQAELKNH